MRLGLLYHWSPTTRRPGIQAHGLVPGSPNVVASTTLEYLCFGLSASGAWALSADTVDAGAHPSWDLWQMRIADTDWVEVRPEFGSLMCEVMIRNPVPVDRLWYVATRVVTG